MQPLSSHKIGIIPARFASTRFPGKPLVEILGKPMFVHVYERSQRCSELEQVVLATDDARIEKAARRWQVPVVMTRSDHPSGTDRVLEACQQLGAAEETVVVNIQGDEPALAPAMLSQLLQLFGTPAVKVATLARPISPSEAGNPDLVKVVLSRSNKALYFSRAPLPFDRDQIPSPSYWGHVGLYGFRMAALQQFVDLPPGDLERAEKLEQLRFLENDIPIHVAITPYESIGVDRPEDLAAVEALLRRQ